GRENRKAPDKDLKFDQKIENYRKRAKRSALAKVGRSSYDIHVRRWAEFRSWIRFNVLPLRVPRLPLLRRYYRDQREAMQALARQVISLRCTRSLPEAKLRHIVNLAIREVRRGRHGEIKVRTLVA